MKKIALFLITLLMATPFFAEEHFKFQGIPIDGNIHNFVGKMKQLGYEEISRENFNGEECVYMLGKFTGKDAALYIWYTAKTKTVYLVDVYLEHAENWQYLKKAYFAYKQYLQSKYGKGESYEYFEAPYKEGDGKELKALREEKCIYTTLFYFSNGAASVDIFPNFEIRLQFADAVNHALYETEKGTRSFDDI